MAVAASLAKCGAVEGFESSLRRADDTRPVGGGHRHDVGVAVQAPVLRGRHVEPALVRPACEQVADELRKQGYEVEVEERGDGRVSLALDHAGEGRFLYEVRPRAFASPSFVVQDSDEGNDARKYFRAEVHLREGGQDYDIMGWSREDVIGDILDQYERHLHYLHMVR